jgi:hypothetical protein
MAINNSQNFDLADELTAVMTGSSVVIGTLLFNPVIIIFDNQGSASVAISKNGGTTTWRTFPAGEALVLDLRAAHGNAPNGTFALGTTFSGTGASGTFSISYIYAVNT